MHGSPLAYARALAAAEDRPGPLVLARDYPRWSSSLGGRRSPLAERVPWITFGAIRLLRRRVGPGKRVFEYGAGGSTLFFLDRGAELVSVEHAPGWAEATRAAAEGSSWDLRVLPPDPQGKGYGSKKMQGSFEGYVRAIDGLGEFDLVLVDGRARNHCVASSIEHVAPGGLMVLDNTERRTRYARGIAQLDDTGWKRRDFSGPGPFNSWFWTTTVWERPAGP